MPRYDEIEERIDRATTDLLVPLRATKVVKIPAMGDLVAAVGELRDLVAGESQIPRRLAGKLWFVFTAMLAEADHAKFPDSILDAAWDYQEQISRVFR